MSLTVLAVYFALAGAISALLVVVPGLVRARAWLGLPVGVLGALAAGVAALALGQDAAAVEVGFVLVILAAIAVKVWQPRWSVLAAELLGASTLACLAYLAYAVYLTIWLLLSYNAIWFVFSVFLLILETSALLRALTYAFEMLDVLSRRPVAAAAQPAGHAPKVAIQVPAYNEPLDVIRPTLESLARLDYPNYVVQVVDNNTPDPDAWRPVEALCRELGPRFQFIHLEDWPGFKAGALNEATRRLPADVELLAIVDADYEVKPEFLQVTVPHFADESVGFVQTPQNYRDWRDDRYLRGLFYSYRYFFDITMPSRAHRNAIIFCGTMGVIRRSALDAVGGWSETCVTEDAEASLRVLGHGYRAVFDPRAMGSGLMPLDFAGLKKQRYRWALGGVQILKMHWRELLPGFSHKLKLTRAQRVAYLLGALQWFGDLLGAAFTLLLALTALGIAFNHRLPVRQLTGALVIVPLLFLVAGLLRATWALRSAERCTWGDAVRALRIWFALSWAVTLACLAGLFKEGAVFLRTPKHKEGQATLVAALGACKTETGLGLLALFSAVAMLIQARNLPFFILGGMLVFQAMLYFSAPWAAAAAEGIELTPFRRIYGSSAQSTGDRPTWAGRAAAVPAGAALGLGTALATGLLVFAPPPSSKPPAPPRINFAAPIPGPLHPTASPSPSPSPSGTPATASPTPSSAPAASPSPLRVASPSPRPSSATTPSAAPTPAPASPSPSTATTPSPSPS